MLTDDEVSALSLRRVEEPGDNLRKPRPTHHRDKFFNQVETYMQTRGVSELDLVLSHKADGWSGCLTLCAGGMLRLEYRTEDGGLMMDIPNRGMYMHERLEGMQLHVEACAFLHGVREMGHYFVPRALQAFKRNGYRNQEREPIHLRLRIFALHSIPWHGRQHTPKKPASTKFLQTLPVQGNNLVDVVPRLVFHVDKKAGGVRYTHPDRKFLCTDYTDFYKHMLELAGDSEGWVLQVPERVFDDDTVRKDTLEGHRHTASLKIKREPVVTCVVTKVENQSGDSMEENSLIFVYCRRGERLVYAGDASDNPSIRARLAHKTAALIYKNAEERKRLYSLTLEDFKGSAVQLTVMAAGITPGGYLSGIKRYGVNRMAWVTPTELSDLQKLATQIPHFVATKQARVDYEEETKQQTEDNPPQPQKKRRVLPQAVVPPPARPVSPPRQHSPEPPVAPPPPRPVDPSKVVVICTPAPKRIQYMPRGTPKPAPVPEPQAASPVPPAKPASPPPLPLAPWPTDEQYEDTAWEEYKAELLRPVAKQEIFYYKNGQKVQYNGMIPVVKLPGSCGVVFEGTGGVAWPVKVFWPVEESQGGEFHWQELHVGQPPPLLERKTYRSPAKPLRIYLDEIFAKDDLLRQRIEFFGGQAVLEKGPDVDVMITSEGAIRRFEGGDNFCTCSWARQEMPAARFATVRTIQAVLRE
jgi:hypothetical protein